MVCDAVAAGLTPGTHKNDVRELLGPPDGEGEVSDVYEIGLEAFSPDEVVLGISYNSEGIVDEIRLAHDWGHERLRPRFLGTCGGNWSFERGDS